MPTPTYNTYVGMRYVPIFDGEWDSTKTYEPLTIVSYQGNSYTSRTFIPVGMNINNTQYWALTGNYNAQVEYYRQETNSLRDEVAQSSKVYDTVAEMVADSSLETGKTCMTLGYYAVNDGGGAMYLITDDTPSKHYEELENDLYAELMEDKCGVSIKQLGCKNMATKAETLTAINSIIAQNQYNILIIPFDINYGYSSSAHIKPNVEVSTIQLIVFDYSIDDTYSEQSQGMDATTLKIWYKTPDDTGNHNGNGIIQGSSWHPYIKLNNYGDDNNRASIFLASDDVINWQISQGVYDADDKFYIARYHDNTSSTVITIDKSTGNIGIGTNNTDSKLGLAVQPSIFVSDGNFVFVSDSMNAGQRTFKFQKRIANNKEITYFNDVNKMSQSFGDSPIKEVNTSNGAIAVTFHTTEGLKVSNVGNTRDLVKITDSVVCPRGVSGSHYTTANRPVITEVGAMIYDQSIGKPIWWSGSGWIDATGASV